MDKLPRCGAVDRASIGSWKAMEKGSLTQPAGVLGKLPGVKINQNYSERQRRARVGNSLLDRGNGTLRNLGGKGSVEREWFFVVRAQCACESAGGRVMKSLFPPKS